jgi:uncharacterized protein YbjT (DUF2867 family)
MFLVMGITGNVGGATARHLLAQGKKVRALVRDREKAAIWTDQGVELVDGDWNDAAAIERALEGVDGAFVMLPAIWAPSPDFKEAKGVIANYVEALTKAPPPRVVALSSMGANRTSGLGMITALALLEQGLHDLAPPIVIVRAGGFFENFLYGLHVAQGGTLPVYYSPTDRKSTMVATKDIGAEVATLLIGPEWSGRRIVELGSMVSADDVAAQLGEVLQRGLCRPTGRVARLVRTVRHPEGTDRRGRSHVRGRQRRLDGPWCQGYGACRWDDVRSRGLRGGAEGRGGVTCDVHTQEDRPGRGHSTAMLSFPKPVSLRVRLAGSGRGRVQMGKPSPDGQPSSGPTPSAGAFRPAGCAKANPRGGTAATFR